MIPMQSCFKIMLLKRTVIVKISSFSIQKFNPSQNHSQFRYYYFILLSDGHIFSVTKRYVYRPFERTVTLHKDSVGQLGFHFKNGQIFRLVKDSSAARNGLLTEHQLLEVDGQNVVGLKDKEIAAFIEKAPSSVTITVIPSFVYDHMMKK